MKTGYSKQIQERINGADDGTIFVNSDFADIAVTEKPGTFGIRAGTKITREESPRIPISPLTAGMIPANVLRSVLFPMPFAPHKRIHSPTPIRKLIFLVNALPSLPITRLSAYKILFSSIIAKIRKNRYL